MKHANRSIVAAVVVLAACLLSTSGCWQQKAVRDAAAAAQAESDAAARAATEAARAMGSARAAQDTAKGVLKQKEYPPLPSPPWHEKYVKLLKERCNVEWEVVQGPAGGSDTLREEVIAYNAFMRTEIERRFGADIFQKLQDEAQGK